MYIMNFMSGDMYYLGTLQMQSVLEIFHTLMTDVKL